jgi:hypothetical protein
MRGFGDAIAASSMRHRALSVRYGLVKVMSPAGEAEMKRKAEERAQQGEPRILLLSGYSTTERFGDDPPIATAKGHQGSLWPQDRQRNVAHRVSPSERHC